MGSLTGYTVGVTGHWRSGELAALLMCHGARVIEGPTVEIEPIADAAALSDATRSVIDDPPDVVVLLTGIGASQWFAWADSAGLRGKLEPALDAAHVVARGSKARGAAAAAGLDIAWSPPSDRIVDIACWLESNPDLNGARVAIQLDGSHDPGFARRLARAGFDVVEVPVYRSMLPADPAPATRLVEAVAERTLDAIMFTSATSVANFFLLADRVGRTADVLASCGATSRPSRIGDPPGSDAVAVACVGPLTASTARTRGIETVVVPDRASIGALVHALASSKKDNRRSFCIAGIDVILQGRSALLGGHELLSLSDRERGVLEVLSRKPGTVVSKRTLLREVWGTLESDGHVAEVAIARLRQRLGRAGAGIETVVRRGYRISEH